VTVSQSIPVQRVWSSVKVVSVQTLSKPAQRSNVHLMLNIDVLMVSALKKLNGVITRSLLVHTTSHSVALPVTVSPKVLSVLSHSNVVELPKNNAQMDHVLSLKIFVHL